MVDQPDWDQAKYGELCQVMEAPEDRRGNMLSTSAFQYRRSVQTQLARFGVFAHLGPSAMLSPLLVCEIGSRIGQHLAQNATSTSERLSSRIWVCRWVTVL